MSEVVSVSSDTVDADSSQSYDSTSSESWSWSLSDTGFDESVTGTVATHRLDDSTITSGETVEYDHSYTDWSSSLSFESMGTYDSTDDSSSNSDSGTASATEESGSSERDEVGGWSSSTSSADSWNAAAVHYSGSSVTSPGSSDTEYSMSGDLDSGADSSAGGETSTALAGGEPGISNDLQRSESSDHFVAGGDDSDGVDSYWISNSGTDTNQSSDSSTGGSGSSTSNGWSDSITSNDSSTSDSDGFTNSTSYDGLGDSDIESTVSESESGSNDYDVYTASGTTFAGGSRSGSSDQGEHASGTSTYYASNDDSDGFVVGTFHGSGENSGENFLDASSTLAESLSDGWQDASQGNDTWAAYDDLSSAHSSQAGLSDDDASSSTDTASGGVVTSAYEETSTSFDNGSDDLTLDSSAQDLASINAVYSNDDGVNSGSSSSTSSVEQDSSTTDVGSQSYSDGWHSYSHAMNGWQGDTDASSGFTSFDGHGDTESGSGSTQSNAWGDAYTDHDVSVTALAGGGSTTTTEDSWGFNSDSGVATSLDDSSNGVHNGSDTTSYDDQGSNGGVWSETAPATTFGSSWADDAGLNSVSDNGTETATAGSGWSYNDADVGDQGTRTSDNVVTSFNDSTDTDFGTGFATNVDQGSDTFDAASFDASTGTSTGYSGSEQFTLAENTSISYSDQAISGQSATHTSQVENGSTFDVEGNDTFAMAATDPSTGDTSWDDGVENYEQGRTRTTFNSDSIGTISSDSSGGTDTLSSGDEVDHDYGSVMTDPTTGDVASTTGSDSYILGMNSGDTYTDFSNGTTTTHTDSGFGGGTYDDQGTETDLTPTTDPDTGDVSTDDNTDSFSEDDASTESFTDENSTIASLTSDDSTVSTSHTDDGTDLVSSSDQDTDISSDTSNNGLATDGTSDTTTEWDSSSDSYGDQSSIIETTLGSDVSVTSSSTSTDGGSDSDSTYDQGTDSSSAASADGLESDVSSDTYTNTESSSDVYSDQSYDFENVASGVVASASSSASSTDSGSDSSWSYDNATDVSSAASQDGLESDASSDNSTNTESSSDINSNQSFNSDSEAGGALLSATSSDSSTDSGSDSSWSYDSGTDSPSSMSADGTESDSSANTYTNTESSSDTDSDQSYDDANEAGGALVSETSSSTSTDTSADTSSNIGTGSDTKKTPTDSDTEIVSETYSDADTSSDTQTDTSSDTSDNEHGTITQTNTTTSDQSGMESSTETSGGTDTFDGIEEDDSDYAGSGSFTENSFDSTTYSNHDDSDTTTDASGRLNGTDSSTDYESETWNDSRQDVDSVSTSAAADDRVTLTDQDSGNTTNQGNVSTSYSTGTPTEQGGSTFQAAEIHSFLETDPASSYSEVTTYNPTVTTPVEEVESTSSTSSSGDGQTRIQKAVFLQTPPSNDSPPNEGPSTTTIGTESSAGKAADQSREDQVPGTLERIGGAAKSLATSLYLWGARAVQYIYDDVRVIPYTLANLPQSFRQTRDSGAQASGAAGAADQIINWWTLGYFSWSGRSIGPQAGQVDAYNQGAGAGRVTVYILNVVSAVNGAASAISGIRAIQVSGGLIRVGQLVTVNGATVSVILLDSGQVVLATAAALEALGVSVAVAASLAEDPRRLREVFSTSMGDSSLEGTLHGTGARTGVTELSSRVKSDSVLRAQLSREGATYEFVYLPEKNVFVINKRFGFSGQSGMSPHQYLRSALTNESTTTVGGVIRVRGGKIIADEFSGHYGENWTPAIRARFTAFMEQYGFTVEQIPFY